MKMTMFKPGILAILFALLLLMGCGKQWVIDSAVLSSSLVSLDYQYEVTKAAVASRADRFSDADRAILEEADASFSRLRNSVRELVDSSGGLPQLLVNADQVRALYTPARQTYNAVRSVICPGILTGVTLSQDNCPALLELSPADQIQIIQFDTTARRAALALEGVMAGGDQNITQAVSDVVSIGATAVRLVRIGALVGI